MKHLIEKCIIFILFSICITTLIFNKSPVSTEEKAKEIGIELIKEKFNENIDLVVFDKGDIWWLVENNQISNVVSCDKPLYQIEIRKKDGKILKMGKY